MSFILDALKKSEQDRGNGSIPNVQTIHSSALNYHQEKRALWPWILIAVLVTNVFILIYFLRPETNTQEVVTNSYIPNQNTTAIKNNPALAPAVTAALITESATQQKIPVSNNNAVTARTKVTPKLKYVIDIDELPANVRQHIPNMVFSAHVYSSNPMQRSLVINDRFMEEGEAFSYDLILVEITRTGAIFDFRDYRFSASVLSGWGSQ